MQCHMDISNYRWEHTQVSLSIRTIFRTIYMVNASRVTLQEQLTAATCIGQFPLGFFFSPYIKRSLNTLENLLWCFSLFSSEAIIKKTAVRCQSCSPSWMFSSHSLYNWHKRRTRCCCSNSRELTEKYFFFLSLFRSTFLLLGDSILAFQPYYKFSVQQKACNSNCG